MPSGFEGESVGVIVLGVLLVGVSLTIHALFMFLILASMGRKRSGYEEFFRWLRSLALRDAVIAAGTPKAPFQS